MAITTGTVLTQARQMISDTVVTYRNSDTKLFLYGDAGQRAFLTDRPSAAYKDDDTELAVLGPDELTVLSTDAPLQIRDSYEERLAHFIACKVFEEDAEDIANQALADKHWNLTGLKRRA